MFKAVIKVIPIENYDLNLTFENGENKIFDMKPYLDLGIFKELKNPEMFNSVRVSFDTIQWQNQADIDPETLYEDSVTAIN
jgi:hypothetical protein